MRSGKEASFNDLNKSLTQLISKYETKKCPKFKDITAAIVTMMKQMLEINNTLISFDQENHELRNEVSFLSDRADFFEMKFNELDQTKVNSDLYLSNFPFEPNCSEVCDKLSILLEIPHDSILNSYSFPQTHHRTSTNVPYSFFGMVVKLKSEQIKINALSKKTQLGIITLQQLTSKKLEPVQAKISIPCVPRHTSFNLLVVSRLLKAKEAKKIRIFQLKNGLFRYKINQYTPWHFIGTDKDLRNIEAYLEPIPEDENEDEDDEETYI